MMPAGDTPVNAATKADDESSQPPNASGRRALLTERTVFATAPTHPSSTGAAAGGSEPATDAVSVARNAAAGAVMSAFSMAVSAAVGAAPPPSLTRDNSSMRKLREPLIDESPADVELSGRPSAAALGRPPSPTPCGDDAVDLLYDDQGNVRPGVDLAALTVSKSTKLARISYVLRMLGASTVNVLDEGRLAGVLTRVALFKVERELLDQVDTDDDEVARSP